MTWQRIAPTYEVFAAEHDTCLSGECWIVAEPGGVFAYDFASRSVSPYDEWIAPFAGPAYVDGPWRLATNGFIQEARLLHRH